MRKSWGRCVYLSLVVVLVLAAGACQKKTVPASQPGYMADSSVSAGMGPSGAGLGLDDARWRELGIAGEAEKREFLEKAQAFENQDIYFDFDSYVLSEPAKRIMDGKVAFLRKYSRVKVTIEGHCDERGTTEYNLALGERRAHSALQYLVNSGISQSNLSTISYGKERPAAPGHDEASWAKNRRAHFVLQY